MSDRPTFDKFMDSFTQELIDTPDAEIQRWAEASSGRTDAVRDAARQLRKALGISQDFDDWPLEKLLLKAAERPFAWEWRFFDTSHEPPGWGEWKRLTPHTRIQSDAEALTEMRHFIKSGFRYQLRPIYAGAVEGCLTPCAGSCCDCGKGCTTDGVDLPVGGQQP